MSKCRLCGSAEMAESRACYFCARAVCLPCQTVVDEVCCRQCADKDPIQPCDDDCPFCVPQMTEQQRLEAKDQMLMLIRDMAKAVRTRSGEGTTGPWAGIAWGKAILGNSFIEAARSFGATDEEIKAALEKPK